MNVLLLLYTYIDGNIGGTNMRIGESFIPGGVTHTLGRNDRGVTPTGESFIPLTPVQGELACMVIVVYSVYCKSVASCRMMNTLLFNLWCNV